MEIEEAVGLLIATTACREQCLLSFRKNLNESVVKNPLERLVDMGIHISECAVENMLESCRPWRTDESLFIVKKLDTTRLMKYIVENS